MSSPPMPMSLLPGWLTAAWVVALYVVWLVHLGHAWTMSGPARWWHAGHLAMAAGMIAMYLLPQHEHAGLYRAGVVVFAAASLAAADYVVANWCARGRLSRLWAATTFGLLAMTYMALPAADRTAAVSYLFAAFLGVEVLLWSLTALRRASAAGPDLPAAGDPAGGAPGTAAPTVGVRLTLAVMAASMAWMLVAMQTMPAAAPMLPMLPVS